MVTVVALMSSPGEILNSVPDDAVVKPSAFATISTNNP